MFLQVEVLTKFINLFQIFNYIYTIFIILIILYGYHVNKIFRHI